MKNVMTIVGARPQFIKAAVVSRAMIAANSLTETIVHTGQHYDKNMSDIFFEEMEIPRPDINLEIQERTHGAMTGKMLIQLEDIMMERKPDIVIVYGDTNSTLAGAMAATKLLIPVAHVEAGMRAHDMIIPEEVNRVLTDRISDILFCTTDVPAENLRNEGMNDNIHIVGDVMYDAVLHYQDKAKPSAIFTNIPEHYYLATIHRQENTDKEEHLRSIFEAFHSLSATMPVVIPLHPRTMKYLKQYDISTEGLILLPPVGYFDMLCLLKNADLVLTDSGGLQKEAYYFDKPVVVMRHRTEWTELLDEGIAILTGHEKEKILDAVSKLKSLKDFPAEIYGNGHAGDKIVDILKAA